MVASRKTEHLDAFDAFRYARITGSQPTPIQAAVVAFRLLFPSIPEEESVDEEPTLVTGTAPTHE